MPRSIQGLVSLTLGADPHCSAQERGLALSWVTGALLLAWLGLSATAAAAWVSSHRRYHPSHLSIASPRSVDRGDPAWSQPANAAHQHGPPTLVCAMNEHEYMP
jgi:hypothetical protein